MDFFEAVKRIGIFMVCAQAILHFKPAQKYGKYLKLLVSVMVLVQLLVPFMNLFTHKEESEFLLRVQQLQTEMDEDIKLLEYENSLNEENILQKVEVEIKSKINKVATKYNIKIQKMTWEHADYTGNVVIYAQEVADLQGDGIRIEPVSKAGQIVVSGEKEEKKGAEDEKTQVLLKEAALILGIEEEQIEVVWV